MNLITFFLLRFILFVIIIPLDPHPPPTGLTSQWLDRFTVMVSWKTQDILNNNNKKLLVNMTRKEVSKVEVESGHECADSNACERLCMSV